MFNALIAIISVLFLQACSPSQATRGNLLTQDRINEIEIGVSNKTDVVKNIGSPTTTAPFDENTWYYIGQLTEKQGFLDREVVEQKVYLAQFDTEETLIAFSLVETEDLDVPIIERQTPTYGNEITILQQLVGNIGRFNPGTQNNGDFGGGTGTGSGTPGSR